VTSILIRLVIQKLTGLRVIGKPGVWTKYFLNKSEYYRHGELSPRKQYRNYSALANKMLVLLSADLVDLPDQTWVL